MEATLAMSPLGPRRHRTAHPGVIALADAFGVDLGADETCRLDYWMCTSRGMQWHVGAEESHPRSPWTPQTDFRIWTNDERSPVIRFSSRMHETAHDEAGFEIHLNPLPQTMLVQLVGRRLGDIVGMPMRDDIRVVSAEDGPGETTCVLNFGTCEYETMRPRRVR